MATPPIKGKIDVTKILKQHLFKGAKGTYLDLVIWPNKDGVDEYGNTHSIKQGLSKEAREAGEKEPFIGSLKFPEEQTPRRAPQGNQRSDKDRLNKPGTGVDDSGDGDVPF